VLGSKPVVALLWVAIVVATSGCQAQSPSGSQSAANAQGEANKATMQRLYDAFGSGDTTIVDSALAENFVEHQVMTGFAPGREGLKQLIAGMKVGFPDLKLGAHQMSADSDLVWAHSSFTGTNTGPFMGTKATGKPIDVEAFDLVRFEGGKIVEHWGIADNMAMMQQLGRGGPMAAGKKPGMK